MSKNVTAELPVTLGEEATINQIPLTLDRRQAASTALLWEHEARGRENAGVSEQRPRIAYDHFARAKRAWGNAATVWAGIADAYAGVDPEQHALCLTHCQAAKQHAEQAQFAQMNCALALPSVIINEPE
jgi:hypothetical protein